MELKRIPLPTADRLTFGEQQPWLLCLCEEEKASLRAALPGHLVALLSDTGVQLYLKQQELGFAFDAIQSAQLYFMRRAKGQGWITLEARLVKTGETFRILDMDRFTESGLKWFIDNQKQLESFIGMPIVVQDCGYDC